LEPAEREIILQSANAVREALQSHEAARLKEANEALDRATEGLAAMIVERAMAQASTRERTS
ncbi:MAG: hypothetical protein M3O66_05050, partial [Verrucomicrobiota bacterium]|nr:hypothetical protein [Verrucomicrobiota bacterium]